MRYIPTSDARVEQLRKLAKKLQRKGGGKHSELLDKVAKQANYDHWHHVVECLGRGAAATGMATLKRECETIADAELRGESKIVVTGPEMEAGPFVLFSTGIGDAWLLDPDEQLGVCLVWQGAKKPLTISEDPARLAIGFHGHYELRGKFFCIQSHETDIGERAIAGYPLDELRPVLEEAKPMDIKFAEIFGQFDSVELTPDTVATLVRQGWSEETLLRAQKEGHRYSPSRNTLLMPVVSSDDLEDDDAADSDAHRFPRQ
jgi:hypothetical protein